MLGERHLEDVHPELTPMIRCVRIGVDPGCSSVWASTTADAQTAVDPLPAGGRNRVRPITRCGSSLSVDLGSRPSNRQCAGAVVDRPIRDGSPARPVAGPPRRPERLGRDQDQRDAPRASRVAQAALSAPDRVARLAWRERCDALLARDFGIRLMAAATGEVPTAASTAV